MDDFLTDPRFIGIRSFEKRLWLSSPTMHGEELAFVQNAIATNWVSTVGENIYELERTVAEYVGMKYAVALSCGTAALHLAIKLAAQRLYPGSAEGNSLMGRKVFCSDMTFDASVNPILYEGGTPVFIDIEPDTWNMDPVALEKAFRIYPDVRLVVLVQLYGVPAKMDEIRKICDDHDAFIVEDAAEAFGAEYEGSYVSGKCGSFGVGNVISYNGNKIITGSSGGMYITDDKVAAEKIRKWSTQSREAAPWYQHEELGYNYRMSNIIAGIARGNMLHIGEHIEQKRKIYERYREGLKDLPVSVNPSEDKAVPNYWLSCLIVGRDAMCRQVRGDREYMYRSEPGKSCPQEILDALSAFNAQGRPVWKPMHMQPLYRRDPFISCGGDDRVGSDEGTSGSGLDVGADIFERGCCLPSDNKMTAEQQDVVIDIIHRCFE